ncbi:40S ribosomal protein S14 [Culex quinquefasciatus]|uniref:40S ribosomal protein S14 n=1 Tax=Culex quinquefasciatus TaxID=7176 RepID=B0WSL9_CULQU|nr:40S ribosomal protein S14 [Culex quinquefasciatus]|eukprot:XP_001852957.1 40S ribosomal protein S14 [Culex quinquefasciatus]
MEDADDLAMPASRCSSIPQLTTVDEQLLIVTRYNFLVTMASCKNKTIKEEFSLYASFNDTFVHVTDLSGKETISLVTGGM